MSSGGSPAPGPASRATARTVVRLSGPDDVLGMIPWRLGFHPTESLVALLLAGRRRRERLVLRLDLPPLDAEPAVVGELARRAVQAGADGVVLLVYTGAPDAGRGLPRAGLVAALRCALDEVGVEVAEAVLVRDGRRWSYLCRDPGCCPAGGVALPRQLAGAAAAYAAEAVGRGAVVLPDRAALRRSVHPSDHPVARAARAQAVTQVTQRLDNLAGDAGADGTAGPTPAPRLAVQRLGELRVRFAAGDRAAPSPADAVLAAVALRDPGVRDEVMTAVLDDDAEPLADLLGMLARGLDDEVAAPVCTVLGWLAYAAGQGALALVALERALAAEPGSTLARLLLEGIERMVPPSVLHEVSRATRAGQQARPATPLGAAEPP